VTRNRACVVLPTFNESKNIVALVRSIVTVCPKEYALEVIVVDDNSPDGTYNLVCQTFADNPRISAVLRNQDRGLAKSIRAGIDRSTADYIIVMDTDFTHDPKEIPNLLHVLQICDVVSCSRFCAGGRMSDLRHYIASLSYNWMLRIVLRTQIQDNSGGYFAVRRATLCLLPFDEIFFGYGDYYFRFLYFAQQAQLKIIEIPGEYLARSLGETKSNWLKMFLMYTGAALSLRIRSRKGSKNGTLSQWDKKSKK
jgi:dolichol-phosphate mannosyltransferase